MRAKLIYNSLVQYVRKTLSNWLNKKSNKACLKDHQIQAQKNDSFIKYLLTAY